MLWCILVVRRKNCIGDLSFFDVFWKKDISLPQKLVIFFKLWSIWVKYDFRHLLDDKKAWNTFLWTFCKNKCLVQFMHFMLYASFLLFCAQRKSRKVCVVIISDLKKQKNNCFCLNFITFVGKNLIDFKISPQCCRMKKNLEFQTVIVSCFRQRPISVCKVTSLG